MSDTLPATAAYRDVMFSRYTRDKLATASVLVNHAIAIAEAGEALRAEDTFEAREGLKDAICALCEAPVAGYLPDALYAVEDVCTRWDVAGDTEISL